jgi:hypothetical protein
VRHARVTSSLAQRFGASVRTPQIEPRPLRGLEALARDNAVEGCVRETFGAAIGCQQALAARDPEIAAIMREIASDEARHAALAWELHAWLMPQLTSDARARVTSARDLAVDQLANELEQAPAGAVRELAGVPDAASAALLHAVLERELWAAA